MKIRELELAYGRIVGDMPVPLKGGMDAATFAYNAIGKSTEERFMCIILNARNRPLGSTVVSKGTLTAALIHPREIFKAAIKANAATLVLVHNHPSGDAQPSSEDDNVTQRLVQAGNVIGIRILDHIIITPDIGRYFSYQESRHALLEVTKDADTSVIHEGNDAAFTINLTHGMSYLDMIEACRHQITTHHLALYQGNITRAATMLGMTREGVHKNVKKFGIDLDFYRRDSQPKD